MRRLAFIIITTLLALTQAEAQVFTSRLQQKLPNGGVVNVMQSAAIDELVNGKGATTPTPDLSSIKAETAKATKTEKTPVQPAEKEKREKEKEKTERPSEKATASETTVDGEMEIPVVDMRKKVMRRSHKVTGYRVQAYAGGNSRSDRQKAEQVGNTIKMSYPDEPIYVHFYSPRWICRVGNYRTYQEASQMLSKVRKLGYKSATIVKGKITVQE